MNGSMQNTENEGVLRGVLDRWNAAVDAHDPERVAAYFTEDAIFQGLHRTASDGRASPTTTARNHSA